MKNNITIYFIESVLIKPANLKKYLFFFSLLLLCFSKNTFSTESIPNKNICRFEGMKEVLTVGNVFEMHCKWSFYTIISSPARIEIPHKEIDKNMQNPMQQTTSPWALFILETVRILPGRGAFKVTSYQPGSHNTGFNIVSDQGVVAVEPLSWEVKSVIPEEKKGKVKPYPPYGPWKKALPLWYWLLGGFTLLSLIIFIILKVRLFIKRKHKINEIKNRLKNKKAFREFIGQLNLLIREVHNKDGKMIISKLDTSFRLFLENEFLIFAMREKPKKIIQEIKKCCPFISKKELKSVLDFFSELEKLSAEKVNPQDCEQMLNQAREIAISFLEKIDRRYS